MTESPTAAILIIGNEILSGRTQDANLAYLGGRLADLGIVLREARVIPDDPDVIVEAINSYRAVHTYVFTTGGIGPTHDDITMECVARAFGVALEINEDARARMEKHYGEALNEARLKMAYAPVGADLVGNPVSAAPGVRMGNVFVLAGVPSIARAMFDGIEGSLTRGAAVLARSADGFVREGDIAAPLERIQNEFPDVSLGSYPFFRDGRLGASIVARGTDLARIEAAIEQVCREMRTLGADPVLGDGT